MADEYTQNDFMKMQEQAIDRVREMQRKAQPQSQQGKPQPQSQQGKAQPQGQQGKPQPQRPSRFFPSEDSRNDFSRQQQKPPQQFQQSQQHQKRENAEKNTSSPPVQNTAVQNPKNTAAHNPLASLLNMDTDMSLIFPLVMLLGKDGADDMLILALLYIMT